MSWLTRIWQEDPPAVVELATQRDAARLAELHAASFHRGWDEDEFEQMLREDNTVIHRMRIRSAVIGFAASRLALDEAEILTIAIEPNHRGHGLSRDLLQTHMGYLAGRGVRALFLEVEENNTPARKLYAKAGFLPVGQRKGYYQDADGRQLNALILRRDLS